MRPDVCAHQSPAVIDGYPALLGQGGRFRQAIPGLSKTASASLPRPRLRAAVPPWPAMLGAARRGGTSKAKSKAKSKAQQKRKATSKAEVSYLSAPYPSSSSPRRRGFSSADFDARMRAVKFENPLLKTLFGRPRISWTPQKHHVCCSLTACVPTTNLGTHGTHGRAAS
jgi:hypothetical protein